MRNKPDWDLIKDLSDKIFNEISLSDADYLADFAENTHTDPLQFSKIVQETAARLIAANAIYEPVRQQQIASVRGMK